MSFFNRNKNTNPVLDEKHGVEIVTRQAQNKKAVEQAKTASAKLNKMIEENGFTVTIALAMGAKQSRGASHGH